MKKIVVSLIACVVFAGCATRQISSEQAQPVPAERVFAFNGIGDSASGQVIVTRDIGAVGGACPLALYIDGTLAAHLQRGESVSLSVPPGNRIVSASFAGKGLCSWGDESAHRREISQVVTAGGRTKIRLALTHDGVIQIGPTTF
ncbi:hypothetical protein D7T48_21010 [Stenotrophomonas maltophilia]|uniref:hypothetical protein n=1 Tax=Stenotrophomonas TaxID=40323 RepID=UPI00130FC1F0|nr:MULTISPECIES: hypothetical protein [Stenotrophomonas]ELC7324200.1 hypothetical protein [Stenotrophomonas maltophilia]MBA0279111.1 hypothetical protein [Stenotrophomonas maltophilia]MBA0414675.1 hypothetical protein [Stenotrophomonas maltophilia]MBA0497515.1 hypothetical protein [Stenotrophomonas maltophilia]MBA0504536.1 hypothetical protein [Stenotrophomonas maltophilia]